MLLFPQIELLASLVIKVLIPLLNGFVEIMWNLCGDFNIWLSLVEEPYLLDQHRQS